MERANRSTPTQTTADLSTSPIEHSKGDASQIYCDLLNTYRKLGAIKTEPEICCEFYVKQACNETIEPDELRQKSNICNFLSAQYFKQLCVLEEKLSVDLAGNDA